MSQFCFLFMMTVHDSSIFVLWWQGIPFYIFPFVKSYSQFPRIGFGLFSGSHENKLISD